MVSRFDNMDLYEYCNHPVTLEKYCEYGFGAEYMVAYGKNVSREQGGKPYRVFDMHQLTEQTHKMSDIFRSYLDNGSMLLVLDVERFSFKYKNKFAEDQHATYGSLEGLDQCILDIFQEWGIDPLTLATGQGYHYALRVDEGKPEHDLLVQIGMGGLRSDVEFLYNHIGPRSSRRRHVTFREAAAFNGAGKLMEYLAQKIMLRAPHYGVNLPTFIGDIFPLNNDNEGINLDLSCFEAPIHMRDIRVPFSPHQKQQVKPGGNPYAPIRVAIPRNVPEHCDRNGGGFKLSLPDLWRLRESYWDAHNYAQQVSMEIPEQAWGVARWAFEYMGSHLGEFHAGFDSAEPHLFGLPDFHEWYEHADFLNPNTMRDLAETYYDGNPATARKLSTYLSECVHNLTGWNTEKYPAETKANFWMRAYCGQLHCGMKF